MEPVHTVANYYDGPIRGVADFGGVPHAYESLFDAREEELDSTFLLHPIDPATFELVLEEWQIWLRWRRAFDRGEARIESHPALPGDRPRHDQITPVLQEKLKIEPATAMRARGHFEVIDGAWMVRWEPMGRDFPP